jgi:hypothetical protein
MPLDVWKRNQRAMANYLVKDFVIFIPGAKALCPFASTRNLPAENINSEKRNRAFSFQS